MIDEGWINHFSFPHDGKEVKKKQPRNPLDTKHKVTLSRKQNKFHYFLYETKNAFWAFFFI